MVYLRRLFQQGQGIFVGDGDYAIMLYNYTNSIASLQLTKHMLRLKEKLPSFNNLYEIGKILPNQQ